MPQIAGAAFNALATAETELEAMCNTSDDNPVVIGDDVFASGGSLPLQLTLSIESLMLAVAHLGRAIFNRVVMLCRDDLTGLPRNLAPAQGAAIGFGAATKLAADLFLTLMDEASPSSLHPTNIANGLEDEATNLPVISRKFSRQINALGKLIAFESVAGFQGVRLRGNRDQLSASRAGSPSGSSRSSRCSTTTGCCPTTSRPRRRRYATRSGPTDCASPIRTPCRSHGIRRSSTRTTRPGPIRRI